MINHRSIKVTVFDDLGVAHVTITRHHRRREYEIKRGSYGDRNLPRILSLARYNSYESGHKKGDRCRYVDGTCGGDVPASFTYVFV